MRGIEKEAQGHRIKNPEQGDPETESWTRGQKALLLSVHGDPDRSLALAQRNYELTEHLGDVFSRTRALTTLCWVRLQVGDASGALEAIERADRIYREAMGSGGEAEAWRTALFALALLGVDRVPDALEHAERAAAIARDRGMRWAEPRALRALGEARAAAGEEEGASEAFEEAAAVARETGSVFELGQVEAARESARIAAS